MNIEPLYLVNSDVYATNNVSQARQDKTQNPIYAQNALQEGDSVEFSANYNSSDTNSLREDFEKTKEEQGLIGKAWDGIKNLFNLKTGSDSVEETLEKYENGEITQEEAQLALEKYKNGQEMSVDVVSDITSGIVAVGAAALAPVTGGASLLVAASAGAVSKTAIKATDALANGREYELKDLGYDIITGSINGAMAPLSNALGGVAGTTVAKTLGLESVETTAKTAGKGILANLLAKGGASYVAKEGAQSGAKVLFAKALSYGADMAVDGALSGAADGFSRALGEGRVEDITDDTLNGALDGLIASPLIGGAMRLSFSGASALGKSVFSEAQDVLTNGVQDTLAKEATQSSVISFSAIDEALEYLNKSTNQNAQVVLDAYNSALKKGKNVTLEQLQGAINLLDNPEFENQIEEYAANLAKKYADKSAIYGSIDEMFEVLGINSDVVYDEVHKCFKAQSDYGAVSIRSKGEGSVVSKIRNKILNLKSIFPQSESAAGSMIGDAHGIRIIAGVSTLDEDDIAQIVKNSISNQDDVDLFIKQLLTGEGEIPAEKLADFEAVKKEVIEKARELQSGKLVENLAQAIENDKVNITELHNYSSKDGIAYFSDKQVDKLQEAYKNWYEKMLEIAKNSPEKSDYTIIEKNNLICLQDKNGYIFNPSMLIETVSKDPSATKASGYTAAQMNVITKDGIQEEFQYRGILADEFSELEHLNYDVKANKDTVAGVQYDSIRNIYKKYNSKEFKEAYNKYLSDTYKAYRSQELGLATKLPDIKDYLSDMLEEDEMQIISRDGLKKLYDLTHSLDKNLAA